MRITLFHDIWRKRGLKNNARCLGLAAISSVIVGIVLAGCATRPSPEVARMSEQLTNVVLHAPVPVVDIHTHTFNAFDLPIENIALGRRDLSPVTWFISDHSAKLLAAAILACTQPEPKGDYGEFAAAQGQVASDIANAYGLKTDVHSVTNSTEFKAVAKAVHRANAMKGLHPKSRETELTPSELRFLKYLQKALHRHDVKTTSVEQRNPVEMLISFLADLTSSDDELLRRYQSQSGGGVQFRVSHMMDLAPTYGQLEVGPLRSFSEQITNIERLQAHDKGLMTYFVAYNPYRDHWPTNNPGEAVRIVADALRNHHAYGVKVYPPGGYRPIHNEMPKRPRTGWHADPAKQWDARYTSNGARIKGEEFDARLLSLLCWCASNNIPVFAHCMDSDMQARAGYAKLMADAHWWRELLDVKSRDCPELKSLRLCLGHAGGPDFWFTKGKTNDWGSDVYYLCTTYPNVYCEVGDLDQIMDDVSQAQFALRMIELCSKNPDTEHAYPFRDKILYGSDWYMPIAARNSAYLKRYQQVFSLVPLEQEYSQFFLANALSFLDAKNRIQRKDFSLSPEVESNLRKLLMSSDQVTHVSAAK